MKPGLADDLDRPHRRFRWWRYEPPRKAWPDHWTGRVPMRFGGPFGCTPNFDWKLAKRILFSFVGRPWDEVSSEIDSVLRAAGARHSYLRGEVRRLVERESLAMIAARPWCREVVPQGDRRARADYRWASFYVCPETGRLLYYVSYRFATSESEANEATSGDRRRQRPKTRRRAPRGKRRAGFRGRR